MDTPLRAATRQTGVLVCGVFNILVGLAWGGFGLFAAAMGGLSVHPSDSLVPLILALAGVFVGASGILVLIPAPDARPRRSGIAVLALAVVVAIAYLIAARALDYNPAEEPAPAASTVIIIPAILSLVLALELVLLWRLRARIQVNRSAPAAG